MSKSRHEYEVGGPWGSMLEALRIAVEFAQTCLAAEIVKPAVETDDPVGLAPVNQLTADRISDDFHNFFLPPDSYMPPPQCGSFA